MIAPLRTSIAIAALAMGVAVASPPPGAGASTPSANWPMARHDPGGSGLTTSTSPITAATVSRLHLLWHGGTTKFSYAQPIVDAGHVIVTTSGGLVQSLSTRTGGLQWHHSFADIGFTDPPVVQNGLVYLGMLTEQTGLVAALRESDGKLVWQHSIAPDTGAKYPVGDITLLTGGGRIYVGADARLIALSPATGRQLWRTIGCTLDGYTCSFGAGFLAYGNERVIASADIYSQVIFDAKTGKLLHTIRLDNDPHAPTVVGNQAYTETGENNDLTGFADITPLNCTGSPCKPSRRISLGVGATNWPTISHGMIFSPTTANPQMKIAPSLIATDLATGKRKWEADIQGAQAFATTAVNDLVFASVPGTRQILAYRAAGCGAAVCSPIWSITVPGDPYDYLWPPTIVGDTIYIESAWNGVFAYRLAWQA